MLVHQAPQDLDKVVVLLHVGHGAQVLERLEAVVVRIVLHLFGRRAGKLEGSRHWKNQRVTRQLFDCTSQSMYLSTHHALDVWVVQRDAPQQFYRYTPSMSFSTHRALDAGFTTNRKPRLHYTSKWQLTTRLMFGLLTTM